MQQCTVDDALQRSVGEFGWGQQQIFFLVSLAFIPSAMQTMLFVFVAHDPVKQHLWVCVPNHEPCQRNLRHILPDICRLPREVWHWTYKGASIVSDWDLICGKAWLAQLPDVSFFAGSALGVLLFSILADHIGRRKSLFAGSALAAVSGIMCAGSPSIWWYVGFRGVVGICTTGMATAAFLLATECIGPSWRGVAGMLTHAFGALGACICALLAGGVHSWRWLTLICSVSSALVLALWTQIPESPKWLMQMGKKGEATSALAAIASSNRTHLPEQPLTDGSSPLKPVTEVLVHSRIRRRFIAMLLAWLVASGSYYGLILCLDHMPSPVFFSALLSFIIEIPSVLFTAALVEQLGRRLTLLMTVLEGGSLCLIATLAHSWLRRMIVIAARAGVVGALVIMHTYASELFPVTIRSQLLLYMSVLARVGPILAPGVEIAATMLKLRFLPFLVYGAALSASSAFILMVPETLGTVSETTPEVGSPTSRRYSPFSLRRLFRMRSGMQYTALWSGEAEQP